MNCINILQGPSMVFERSVEFEPLKFRRTKFNCNIMTLSSALVLASASASAPSLVLVYLFVMVHLLNFIKCIHFKLGTHFHC